MTGPTYFSILHLEERDALNLHLVQSVNQLTGTSSPVLSEYVTVSNKTVTREVRKLIETSFVVPTLCDIASMSEE